MKFDLYIKSINKETETIIFSYYPTDLTVKQLSKAMEIFSSKIKNTLYENGDLSNIIGFGITTEV